MSSTEEARLVREVLGKGPVGGPSEAVVVDPTGVTLEQDAERLALSVTGATPQIAIGNLGHLTVRVR